MKTFKTYFNEATEAPLENWKELQQNNKMLATGVRLCKQIEKLGGEALIVGGAVRDIVLKKPIKDIDIATNVPMVKLKQHFKWNEIGLSGKVGIIQIHFGGFDYEVANYREETGTSDSRHPDKITYVNKFEDDSARRDITINSMGLNVNGEIQDYQGGLEDLANGIIKSVGKPRERFKEDATRLLRVFRFASRYGFDIESQTLNDLEDLVDDVDIIKPEAKMNELIKSAGSGKGLANYIEYLDKSGYLDRILPEVKALQGKKQDPKHHPEGDAYQHTLAALNHSPSKNPTTNLAILLHDIGKGTVDSPKHKKTKQPTYNEHDKEGAKLAEEITRRLKFSNETREAIVFAAKRHMVTHYINDMSKKKIASIVNNKYWPILKDVVQADEMSRGNIGKGGIDEFNAKMKTAEDTAQKLSGQGGAEGLRLRIKEKIDGKKVMDWTGLPPGNEMGTILKLTQDWLYNNMEASDKEVRDYVEAQYTEMIDKNPPSLEEQYNIIRRRNYGQETL